MWLVVYIYIYIYIHMSHGYVKRKPDQVKHKRIDC